MHNILNLVPEKRNADKVCNAKVSPFIEGGIAQEFLAVLQLLGPLVVAVGDWMMNTQ